jgi:hypothetical protein
MKSNKTIRIFFSFLIIFIISIFAFVFVIISNSYKPDFDVSKVNNANANYAYVETNGNFLYIPKDNNLKGIIIYPGGLIEPLSYSTLCAALAVENYTCVIASMPLNLALLDINKAKSIIDEIKYVKEWSILGHSLGGAMACRFISEYGPYVAKLFLLASYCDIDLSKTNHEIISIYGSEDKILNIETYLRYKKNLPTDFKEIIISGGNHSYFGSYGIQNGDGEGISNQEQISQTVQAIKNIF